MELKGYFSTGGGLVELRWILYCSRLQVFLGGFSSRVFSKCHSTANFSRFFPLPTIYCTILVRIRLKISSPSFTTVQLTVELSFKLTASPHGPSSRFNPASPVWYPLYYRHPTNHRTFTNRLDPFAFYITTTRPFIALSQIFSSSLFFTFTLHHCLSLSHKLCPAPCPSTVISRHSLSHCYKNSSASCTTLHHYQTVFPLSRSVWGFRTLN